MRSLHCSASELVTQYAAYHRDRRNVLTHFVGIPLIILAIAMFMVQPMFEDVTWAWFVWVITSAWYLTRGNWLLGLTTTCVNGMLIALAHVLAKQVPVWGLASWQLAFVLFVVGWVFQFVGHYWEGRKPAFVDDLVGLLVGPMFVVAEWLMMLGLLSELRASMESEEKPVDG